MALYESSKLANLSASWSVNIIEEDSVMLQIPATGRYQIIFGGITNKSPGQSLVIEYYDAAGNTVSKSLALVYNNLGMKVVEDNLYTNHALNYITMSQTGAGALYTVGTQAFLALVKID